MAVILDKASKARTKAIQLQGMAFTSELTKQMLDQADELEKLYSKLKTACQEEPPDDTKIEGLVKSYETKKKEHETAEEGLISWMVPNITKQLSLTGWPII